MAQGHQHREQLPARLLRCLEDLTHKDLKRFKWHLCQPLRDCWKPVPRGRLEGLDEMDMVDTIVEAYSMKGALEITLYILQKMDLNELAVWLQKDTLPSTLVDRKASLSVPVPLPANTGQQVEGMDCSSDSDDSVYWDAEEGNESLSVGSEEGAAASVMSLSVEHEEGAAVSRASFFEGHEEVQATSTNNLTAGLHMGATVSEQHENGCSALKLPEDPEKQGTTCFVSLTGNDEELYDCSITRLPGDPEQRVVTFDTSPSEELEDGSNASLSRLAGDPKGQLDTSDTKVTGKLEEEHGNSERNPLDGALKCYSKRVTSLREPKNLLEDLTLDQTFKMLYKTLQQLVEDELERFKTRLFKDYPELFDSSLEDKHALDVVKMLLDGTARLESVNITTQVLRSIDQEALANSLARENENAIRKFQQQLFFKVKREFKRIF
ncbi:hypothetical protein GN956_G9636 [Arapaima gigas]